MNSKIKQLRVYVAPTQHLVTPAVSRISAPLPIMLGKPERRVDFGRIPDKRPDFEPASQIVRLNFLAVKLR